MQLQVVTNQGVSQAFIEKQKDPARAWRDDMNKIRDDPLLAIKQAEKRQREKIMDNPLKIAQFKEVTHFFLSCSPSSRALRQQYMYCIHQQDMRSDAAWRHFAYAAVQ
jgi:hypothetical protein